MIQQFPYSPPDSGLTWDKGRAREAFPRDQQVLELVWYPWPGPSCADDHLPLGPYCSPWGSAQCGSSALPSLNTSFVLPTTAKGITAVFPSVAILPLDAQLKKKLKKQLQASASISAFRHSCLVQGVLPQQIEIASRGCTAMSQEGRKA